jgi:hypothetical protein
MGRIDSRIEIVANDVSNVNEFVKQLTLLKTPLVAKTLHNVECEKGWSAVYLSNGGLYVAPILTRSEVVTVVNSQRFPINRFYTSKQFGIGITLKAYAELIDTFNRSRNGSEYVSLWVKMLNRLFHYKEQMTHDKAPIESLLNL